MVLRVLQLSNTFAVRAGGPTQNAFELHDALNRREDVRSALLASSGDEERPVGMIAPPSSPSERDPSAPIQHGLLRAARVMRLLATSDIVLLHGYYTVVAPVIAPLGRLMGKTILLIPHGSLTRHQRKQSRRKKRLWELLPGPMIRIGSHAFIVGSEVEKQELLEVFHDLRVHVSGIGTPLPAVETDRRHDDGPVRLLSLSRIAPKKRIDLMIDAVGELRRRGVETRLRVAGSGSAALERELRARARQLGVGDAVEFVGMLVGAEKEAAYAAAQYFLAPSDDENFGISAAEALARGVPCVSSAAVASTTGLPSSAGAVIVAPSGATIADAVQRLMREDQGVLRAGARRFAEEHYDWNVVAAEWMRLFAVLHTDRLRRLPIPSAP